MVERRRLRSDWSEIHNVSSLIVKNAPWGFLVFELAKPERLCLVHANPEALEIVRVGLSELYDHTFVDFWPEAHASKMKQQCLGVLEGRNAFEQEGAFASDLAEGEFRFHVFAISESYLAVAFEDITMLREKEKSLRDSEERFRMLADAASEGIVVLDGDEVVEVNRASLAMFGYTRQEALGMHAQDFIAPESHGIVEKNIRRQHTRAYRAVGLRKNGEKFPVRISGRPFRHKGRDLRVSVTQDLSNEEMLKSLRVLASTDELTNLRNHRVFQEVLQKEVERSLRSGSPLSLLIADIDHFKKVNDTHGHLVGDQVLRHIAQLLTNGRRVNDLVARYGGEEFALLLPDVSHEKACEVAERIRTKVEANPLCDGGKVIHVTVSVGIASCPAHAKTPDELFVAADRALYAAKHAGRNQIMLSSP